MVRLSDNDLVNQYAFDFMKYEHINNKDSSSNGLLEQFCKQNNILDLLSEVESSFNLMFIGVLQEGGIIKHDSMLEFDTYQDYIDSIKQLRKQAKKRYIDKWVDQSKARRYYIDTEPVTKKDKILDSKKDIAFDVIEEYYDEKFFTISNLNKNYILIKERDYGSNKRIGIQVILEPYASQFTINIRGILGNYNICNEGSGWDLELEKGAKMFSLSKTYQGKLPTKRELIDDICIIDVLESQEPVSRILKDSGVINIYPTSKEYFDNFKA